MLKNRLDVTELEKSVMKYLGEKVCGICHMSLTDNKFRQHLFFCPECKNLIHGKCMETWMTKKSVVDGIIIEKGCIYCKNKNIF